MNVDAVSTPSYWVLAAGEHVGFNGAKHFSTPLKDLFKQYGKHSLSTALYENKKVFQYLGCVQPLVDRIL